MPTSPINAALNELLYSKISSWNLELTNAQLYGYAYTYPSVYHMICFAYCVSILCARVKVKISFLDLPANYARPRMYTSIDNTYVYLSIYASPRRPKTCIADERMVFAGVTLPDSLAFTNISWQLHKVMSQLHRPLPPY